MPRISDIAGAPSVVCPKCNGQEVIPDPNDPTQTIECDLCDGSGRVSPAKAQSFTP